MEIKKMLEETKECEILKDMRKTAEDTAEKAQSISERATMRRYELLDELQSDRIRGVVYTSDLDEIERGIEGIESRESIARKIIALQNAIRMPWRDEPNFREAAEQYLTFIVPILEDIEKEKNKSVTNIHELKKQYNEELSAHKNDIINYDELIEDLLEPVHECGDWISHKVWGRMFGRVLKSDEFARRKADIYKK